MPFPANSPTIDDLPGLGLQDIAQLKAAVIAVVLHYSMADPLG